MKKLHSLQFICLLLLGAVFISSCSSDEEEEPTPDPTPTMMTSTIWDGPRITFSKADGTDETQEANQDRINDDVWITRGTAGGEIFNIRTESESTQGVSPAGTRWAVGTTDNLSDLQFDSFRNAVGSPREVIGVNLVLQLIEEDVLIDLQFTAWSQGRNDGGGFSYTRTSRP